MGPPCSLLDIKQIGKHYLVKSTGNMADFKDAYMPVKFHKHKNGIKRHYTEAFCMRKQVKQIIIDMARAQLAP